MSIIRRSNACSRGPNLVTESDNAVNNAGSESSSSKSEHMLGTESSVKRGHRVESILKTVKRGVSEAAQRRSSDTRPDPSSGGIHAKMEGCGGDGN